MLRINSSHCNTIEINCWTKWNALPVYKQNTFYQPILRFCIYVQMVKERGQIMYLYFAASSLYKVGKAIQSDICHPCVKMFCRYLGYMTFCNRMYLSAGRDSYFTRTALCLALPQLVELVYDMQQRVVMMMRFALIVMEGGHFVQEKLFWQHNDLFS